MKQVKFFIVRSHNEVAIEEEVNTFLSENDGKIEVNDIKLSATAINPHGNEWQLYTVVVVYDTIEE